MLTFRYCKSVLIFFLLCLTEKEQTPLQEALNQLIRQLQRCCTELPFFYWLHCHQSCDYIKRSLALPYSTVKLSLLSPWKLEINIVCVCFLFRKDPSSFFSFPVTDLIAPGYSSIIKRPMDFSTMKERVKKGGYQSLDELKVFVLSHTGVSLQAKYTKTNNPRLSRGCPNG